MIAIGYALETPRPALSFKFEVPVCTPGEVASRFFSYELFSSLFGSAFTHGLVTGVLAAFSVVSADFEDGFFRVYVRGSRGYMYRL